MLIALVPLLPLAAAVILLLSGPRWKRTSAGWLASLAGAAAFACAVGFWTELLGRPASGRLMVVTLYRWIAVGGFQVDVAFRADPLSAIMALVVTGVGTLILVYSIGYMGGDPRFPRFFAYMSLFVFFMLTLVLANNFLLLYVGWEGVGLCSYLLIGFWFERPSAADAAKKAFIVTRVGDAGFMLGIVLIWFRFHSLDYSTVFAEAPRLGATFPHGTITAICLLLLAGAVGKSAQFPLHTWLPDAMEGPTPVSALIHAATMVTAGVYLVVRAHALFALSDAASTAVAVVGIVTAVYAGISAVGQDDIKRTLAYSTLSQIGFMFFGAGIGAPAAAIFLLVAHAFYKALLFLASGSVIHGLHDEQDMMKMGGLRRWMPLSTTVWVVAALAISGVPPLVGFFAKDQVIAAASMAGRWGFWIAALVGAFLTALYIWRATFMAFFGAPRVEHEPHEAPAVMRPSLVLLAIGAAFGGLLGLSMSSGIIARFLQPIVGPAPAVLHGPSETVLSIISVIVALAGIFVAWAVYGSGRLDWIAMRVRLAAGKRALERAFYVNDAYGAVFGGAGKLGAAFLAYVVDNRLIDGVVRGVARTVGVTATVGRRVQTGLVRTYALAFLVGVVAILWYVAVRA